MRYVTAADLATCLPAAPSPTADAPLALASRDVDARLVRHLAVELPLALARRHAADLLW